MRVLLLFLLLVALGAGAWWLRGRDAAPGPPPERPGEGAPPAAAGFVGSDACKECHEERHATWLETAHAYSLRAPSESTVEGRFDGVPVESKRFIATPERRPDGWYVKVEGRDGRWRGGNYKVTHVVGRHFEQAYLFTGPRGEWRVLPICWSIERKRWDLTHEVLMDIVGSVEAPTDDFDTRVMIFNHGCGQCHATDYDVGHALPPEGAPLYRSRYLEGAVACESCHGPGSVHAEWHRAPGDGDGAAARLLHPRRDLDAKGVLESCGRCHYQHEWRYAIDDDPRASFHDIAITQAYDQGGFFADGRLDGLRYHGTTQSQSACFEKGDMSCLSCHRMHGGKRWAMKWEENDDAQCTQCHEAGTYAAKTHTFHDAVACVDCHMPKLLGRERVLHFMRDHSIRNPMPELTERFGSDHAPNACNVCHAERTAGWSREWKEKWWGSGGREAVDAMALGVGLVVDLRNDPGRVDTARLSALAADAAQKRFFRLTALRELGRRPGPEAAAVLRSLLGDPDPEVVQLVLAGLEERPDPASGPALMKLLDHPTRPVRVDAAWALARIGWRAEGEDTERLWRDTEAMLVRQGHFTAFLRRIVEIADAVGRFDESSRYLKELVRVAPAVALDGLHRRARRLTEEGRHEDALLAYGEVRRALPEGADAAVQILFIDSADSLAAAGETNAAAGNWAHALSNFTPGGVLHVIAESRLRALQGDRAEAERRLRELEAKLAEAPWNREMLRRVRWSLKVVRGTG